MPKEKGLFPKPAGESERYWGNQGVGTIGPVTCEWCGTNHPEQKLGDDGHTLDTVLGKQLVEDCCGKVIDTLYRELGAQFTSAYLEEFAQNPLDPRFSVLRLTLKKVLHEAFRQIETGRADVLAARADVLAAVKDFTSSRLA